MDEEKQIAFAKFASEENLKPEKLQELIEDYLFSQRTPTRQEVIDTLESQPSILQRKTIGEKLLLKFKGFVDTFCSN